MEQYFFIGIKGSGMSALAQILFDTGHLVSGCDIPEYVFTEQSLRARNISILTFEESRLFQTKDEFLLSAFGRTDITPVLIIGNAFPDDHEVVTQLSAWGFNTIRYHLFLTTLIQTHRSVAISGTHGKTTTTGMFSHAFANILPSHTLIGDGTGNGCQDASHFLFEACEYRNHFHSYHPDYAVITNIEFDHPDFFKSEEDVISSFLVFASQVKKNVIACGDDAIIHRIATSPKWVTYGLQDGNDIQACHIRTDFEGTTFDVKVNRQDLFGHGETFQNVKIPLHGMHSVQNALSVIAFALLEELDADSFVSFMDQLASFGGVKRRFQLEEVEGLTLINDYAHHPTEIKATLSSVKSKFKDHRIVAVFQPHTYSRTSMFLEEFAASFSLADEVYLCDIFGSAREAAGSVSIADLVNKTPNARYLPFDGMGSLLQTEQAVYVFMGAGDIEKYMTEFKNWLSVTA